MYYDVIHNEFKEIVKIIELFMKKKSSIDSIQFSAKLIADIFKMGGKVLSCGNGGSHCNAMHFAEELTGRFRQDRIGYPVIAISDPAYLSCVSNDFGYEQVFSRYIEAVGKKKDILFVISSSGQSINILNAIKTAHYMGMKSIFLTKENSDNNFISKYVDVEICVPNSDYLDYIQEIHMKIIHTIVLIIEKEMLMN